LDCFCLLSQILHINNLIKATVISLNIQVKIIKLFSNNRNDLNLTFSINIR